MNDSRLRIMYREMKYRGVFETGASVKFLQWARCAHRKRDINVGRNQRQNVVCLSHCHAPQYGGDIRESRWEPPMVACVRLSCVYDASFGVEAGQIKRSTAKRSVGKEARV